MHCPQQLYRYKVIPLLPALSENYIYILFSILKDVLKNLIIYNFTLKFVILSIANIYTISYTEGYLYNILAYKIKKHICTNITCDYKVKHITPFILFINTFN